MAACTARTLVVESDASRIPPSYLRRASVSDWTAVEIPWMELASEVAGSVERAAALGRAVVVTVKQKIKETRNDWSCILRKGLVGPPEFFVLFLL